MSPYLLTVHDVNFIEDEFNDLMLSDGYKNLFHFPKFVDFVKSITRLFHLKQRHHQR